MSERFIYMVSSFETKRHTKSHTDMYFAHAEHTQWVFEADDWHRGLIRVEYIAVPVDSKYYEMAVECSNLQFWAAKQAQLMKEFKRFRMQECVICYETKHGYDMGADCRTCKNSMCLKCADQYHHANFGKFPHINKWTGYDILLPCPMCRTDILFSF